MSICDHPAIDKRELRSLKNQRRMCVWVVCPVCDYGRWRVESEVKRLLGAGEFNGHCRNCRLDKGGQPSGQNNVQWRGGYITVGEGYKAVHISRLSEEDMAFAEPMRRSTGYVLEHRLIVARELGRPLQEEEVVHHINGVKDDNRVENLTLLTTATHHKGHGDKYYQKWREACLKIERLEDFLDMHIPNWRSLV